MSGSTRSRFWVAQRFSAAVQAFRMSRAGGLKIYGSSGDLTSAAEAVRRISTRIAALKRCATQNQEKCRSLTAAFTRCRALSSNASVRPNAGPTMEA